jgi:hypothetical protein
VFLLFWGVEDSYCLEREVIFFDLIEIVYFRCVDAHQIVYSAKSKQLLLFMTVHCDDSPYR